MAVVFEPEPVTVADVNPVLELDAAELVEEVKSWTISTTPPISCYGFDIRIVTDSDERQVAENALCADDRLSPEHLSVMFPATCGSRVPHRDLRSAGLV